MPNLLSFREYPYLCHGVYDDDHLIGTFILHPYSEKEGSRVSRILRVERPLLNMDLSVKKRTEIYKLVRNYISDFGKDSCDILEMELYERIDNEVYFPSSLCVVGTFNFPQDSHLLVDWSFETARTTICFELQKEENLQMTNRKKSSKESIGVLPFFRRRSKKPTAQYSSYEPLTEREFVLQPFAFNLPEYCLARRNPRSLVCWFPDLYLLSKNNWRHLIGYGDEMRKKILTIDRGKIYLSLGMDTPMLLEDLPAIWKDHIFPSINRLQIFSEETYRRDIARNNGKIVHSMKLFRKYVN